MFGLGGFFNKDSAPKTITALADGFDNLFTSDEETMTRQAVLDKLKMQPHVLQALTNKIAAGHVNWFVAGGRPFILWVCGFNWAQMGVAVIWFNKDIPEWFVESSVVLTMGSLGLYGTMRSIEKLKGKSQ